MQLRTKAVRSVQWIGLSQVTRQVVQFGALTILAALLDPDDFGLLAMALVVTGFMDMFKDLGTRVAIIQKKDASDLFLSSIFWVNIAMGIIACLLLLGAAPVVSLFYKEPRLTTILQVLAIGFPISGLGISVKANLEKNISFGVVGLIEAASAIVASSTAIVLAWMGYGVWSLVFQSLVLETVSTILFWIFSKWRPSFKFDWQEVKNVLGYSLNYTAFTITNYLARNVDYLLIGRYLGKEALGYYTLAYRIMVYPLYNISSVLNRVMFPVMSQVQGDNERIRSGYLRIIEGVALTTFPLMIGVFALADPFVHVVLGDRWLPVIGLLMILAPVGMMQAVTSTVGPVYLTKGKTGSLLAWGLFNGTLLTAGFAIGLQWGIEGVAWAYLIVSVIAFYPGLYIPMRFIELKTSRVLAALTRSLCAGLVMLGVLWGVRQFIPESIQYRVWVFAGLVLLGIIVYGALTLLINRSQINGLIQLFKERKGAHANTSTT